MLASGGGAVDVSAVQRVEIDGKFFRAGGRRLRLRAVTYGPFPPERERTWEEDFRRMRDLGFNAIRVYDLPERALLDAAEGAGLYVMADLAWERGRDFLGERAILRAAEEKLVSWLRQEGGHAALAAVLVGNEIPSQMARWMGPVAVRRAIDGLIRAGRRVAPDLLFAYANFPTSEYLEPQEADFTAFNLYLESADELASYLDRLHHVAGDRPVMITEFGLDTQRHGEEAQADLLRAFLRATREAGMAGVTVYAWSDEWFNNGEVVADWSFGLRRRDGSEKPAMGELAELLPAWDGVPEGDLPKISVIVCTRNGARRMAYCLGALFEVDYPDFEVIVVDDGSEDETAEEVRKFPAARLLRQEPMGLSAARNAGAAVAEGAIFSYVDDDCEVDGEYLRWLAWGFSQGDWVALGGPNLAPPARDATMALVNAAPGAATHVMVDDREAEHLPGCHLAVRREAFEAIEGFDPVFQSAGDDVDFCWRLRAAGGRLGFCGASFVWHHRRTTLRAYLRQQRGYGRAEALLYQKFPEKFAGGGIRWEGFVYAGAALGVEPGDVIYHGILGTEPYQMLHLRRLPQRPLPEEFDRPAMRRALRWLSWARARVRIWGRWWHGGPRGERKKRWRRYGDDLREDLEMAFWGQGGEGYLCLYEALLSAHWQPGGGQDWDLESGECLLLAATEEVGEKWRRTLVRARFVPGERKRLAREIERAARSAGLLVEKEEAAGVESGDDE